MENAQPNGLSEDELAAESATALPDKEVVSILDLNADLDLAIDAAAPIDLAVAANANVAAPIDAAVGANILSSGSTAQALSDQGVMINQDVTGDATANSVQDSTLEQGASPDASTADAGTTDAAGGTTDTTSAAGGGTTDALGGTTDALGDTTENTVGGVTDGLGGATGGATDGLGGATDGLGGATDGLGGATDGLGTSVGNLADGNLLNVNVDLAADANIAAPINGAVAANANVAAPIDAAVAANIGSVDSNAVAVSQQDAIINQSIDGTAEANAEQTSDISQPDQPQP